MKSTGGKGENKTEEAEVVVVEENGISTSTVTSGDTSCSEEDGDDGKEDINGENEAIIGDRHRHRRTHIDIVVVVEPGVLVDSCENANPTQTPTKKSVSSHKKSVTIGTIEQEDSKAPKLANGTSLAVENNLNAVSRGSCESCAAYNFQTGPSAQRSHSLPLKKKQWSKGSNIGESGEITTIQELTAEQSNTVSGVLRFCKQRVLFPYLRLLGGMGLRPLFNDGNDSDVWRMVCSRLYLVIVGLVLVIGYCLQIFTCFRRDIGFSYKENIRNLPTSLAKSFDYYENAAGNNLINSTRHAELLQAGTEADEIDEDLWLLQKTICTGSIFFVYMVPSILHMATFIYMVYLYWVYDDEHLQNLMERVFIQAAHANINYFSQRRLIKRLQVLVGCGCIWISLLTLCQFFHAYLNDIYVNIWIELSYSETIATAFILLVATLWQDAIQVTIVISFAIHCSLICTFTELIRGRLMQHSISLTECMKDLGELCQLLSYLNDDLALGLAPLLLINGIYATGSLVELVNNSKNISVPMISLHAVTSFLWISIVIFPLVMAAMVSSCCQKLKDMGHIIRIRPFGYQFTQQIDLDSFLLFVSNLNLKARIIKVPITVPILSVVGIALSITALLWGYFP